MQPKPRDSHFRPTTLSIVLCGGVASLLCFLFNDEQNKLVVPLLLLLAMPPIALFWGKRAAIAGSVVASLAFDVLLFPPFYSLRIQHATDRLVLFSFQALAILMAYLSEVRVP